MFFFATEASRIVGKLVRLTEGAHLVYYWVSQLYTYIAFALAQNTATLKSSSPEFQHLADAISRKDFRASSQVNRDHENIVKFALQKAARMVPHSPI